MFREYAERETDPLPFGYGCVALNDSKNPGFPSFPVVHRRHVEAFGGFCPPAFVNQDGDPWVFELYRPFGASKFAAAVSIRNEIGGASDTLGGGALVPAPAATAAASPRYERTAVLWKDRLADDIAVVLQAMGRLAAPKVTLDVVVPTFRTNMGILSKIVSMDIPADADVMFIIIVDDPDTPWRKELKELALLPHKVRVRFNAANVGVSVSRNRGVDESSAEWVLFIDDDVEVGSDLLAQYVTAIRRRGDQAAGFVGLTSFPKPETVQQAGVAMSYVTFFWSVADRMTECPWGVTANLLLRRTPVRFDTDFIKTGGGEDIAMCIDTAGFCGKPLLAAPAAHAVHPWWGGETGGRINRMRFFDWTQGDGLLNYKYPELCYMSAPNVVELSLLALAVALLPRATLWGAGWLCWVWVVEVGMDLFHYMVVDRETAGHESGLRRVVCSLEATLVKAHVEAGHAWVHLKRGRPDMLLHRFDWYCGQEPDAVQRGRVESLGRFVGFVLPLLLARVWCCW
jgi:hypothetical protein